MKGRNENNIQKVWENVPKNAETCKTYQTFAILHNTQHLATGQSSFFFITTINFQHNPNSLTYTLISKPTWGGRVTLLKPNILPNITNNIQLKIPLEGMGGGGMAPGGTF